MKYSMCDNGVKEASDYCRMQRYPEVSNVPAFVHRGRCWYSTVGHLQCPLWDGLILPHTPP